VRRWTRIAVREKVQDLRQKAWPGGRIIGDVQEDLQLQVGVREALKKIGRDPMTIEQYKRILKDWKPKEKERGQALSGLFSSQALLGPEVCWGLCEHAQAPRALPREEEAVRNAVPARQQAFRSGRAAARSAAQELAPQLTEDFELLVGEHRQPRWPNAIIGSIAHGPRCSMRRSPRASPIARSASTSSAVAR
jgi:hypothetical protein